MRNTTRFALWRHLHHELAHDPPEVVVGRGALLGVLGDGVGHRPAGDAHLHRAQLLEVAAHGGLGRDHAVGRQHLHQLGLAGDRLLLEQAGDAVLALRFAERGHLSRSLWS